MTSTPLGKILEQVRSLGRGEQLELRSALDALLAQPEPGRAEDQVERLLLERGLLSEIKAPLTDPEPYRNRQLVQIEGKPLSETIVEERR